MIDNILYIILIISFAFIVAFLLRYILIDYIHDKTVEKIFDMQDNEILSSQESKKKAEFKLKLQRAGLTRKDFNEIIVASVIAAVSLIFLIYIIDFSPFTKYFIIFLAVIMPFVVPYFYLEEQVSARIKRIDNDLAIFIDLLIIILEGGGGLNNAIDKVTTDGKGVLGKDLLYESSMFKHEFITYGGEVAYANLANRTGSEAIATIVGFMKLSEETGIGVKTIFENQAQDIKDAELLDVEKKAATMNISLTFTMFLFIIPAVIAMIGFPMAADALMPGF